MKTFKALYIDNGVIKAGNFPKELGSPLESANFGEDFIAWQEYQEALASAKANAVVCEDQDGAGKMIAVRAPYAGNNFIFPLPSGWDYMVEKVRACTSDCECDEPCIVRVVAKLYRTDEQMESENSQMEDEIWQEVKAIVSHCKFCFVSDYPNAMIADLKERFTITRRK